MKIMARDNDSLSPLCSESCCVITGVIISRVLYYVFKDTFIDHYQRRQNILIVPSADDDRYHKTHWIEMH